MTTEFAKQVMIGTAALLTTLTETGGGPESSLYLAIGSDIEVSNAVTSICARKGWITNRAHWLEITSAGREIANQINAAVSK
jgi:hypothetical protein